MCKGVSLGQLSISCAVKALPIYLQLSKSLFAFAVKTVDLRAGETAQCLRELIALAEDQGLVPSAHMVALMSVTPALGELMSASDLREYQTPIRCTHIHAGKILVHIINFLNVNEFRFATI